MMSLLIVNGEKYSVFLNFFLVQIISFLQTVFPGVNCFAVIQYVSCFLAIVFINYVFLKINNRYFSYIISVFITIILFLTSILMFQWTHTTTLVCASGILLITCSAYHETRRNKKIIQIICGILVIILSSGFRFDSFKVCVLFSLLLCGSILIKTVIKNKREFEQSPLKTIVIQALKRSLTFLLAVFISFSVSFCLNILSEEICKTNPSYIKHYEYSYARANVSDYKIEPYQGNEAFYKSVNISQNDLDFWNSFTIDKDYFEKDTLIAVNNYKEKSLYNDSRISFAIKKNLLLVKESLKQYYRDLLKLKSAMHISFSNKGFVVLLMLLLLVIIIALNLLIRKILKKKKREFVGNHIILVSLLIVFWIAFLIVVRIDESNFLFVIVFALILANLIINRFNNFWILVLFSLGTTGLYLYQRCFRMFFRVSYTFLIPTIVFLLYILVKSQNLKKSAKVPFVRIISALVVVAISILFSCSLFWHQHYIPSTKAYDSTLKTYIKDHSEYEYVSIWIGSLIDPAYTNAVLSPTVIKNNTDFASWYKSSDYYENLIQEKFSKPVLEEAINNNSVRFIIKNSSDSAILEQFYQEHYSSFGTIKVLQDDKIDVSGKLNDNTSIQVTAYVYKVLVE